MAADPILEARFPLGDAAGLIGYHRSPHGGMVHDDEIDAVINRYDITAAPVREYSGDLWIPAEPWRNQWATGPVAQHRDLISAALTGFGILLALVAYSALLLAITKGMTW